jgi:hypothetical protein
MHSRLERRTFREHAGLSSSRQGRAAGRCVRWTRLTKVTEIRAAVDLDSAQWLLQSDVDWWDLVRYGPPGFDVYVRIAFSPESGSDVVNHPDEAPVDSMRAALAVLASYATTSARGYAAIGTVALSDRCQPAPQDLRCVGPSPSHSSGQPLADLNQAENGDRSGATQEIFLRSRVGMA